MKRSIIEAVFKSDRKKVWNTVTDNENYEWRSDLSKIIVSPDQKKFYEYTKNGTKTEFDITLKIPYESYEFNMNNKHMSGHWKGVFIDEENGTKIVFTEEVELKNPFIRLFAGAYLKKQQAAYISDLRKALE